jgi:uncharacterized protein YxeA
MNPEKSTFIKKHLKPILIGSTAVILIGIAAFFIFKNKPASTEGKQAYAKYVQAYTSGTVSKKSFIKVQLASEVSTMGEMGKPDERKLFSFSPSLKGKTYWLDAQTVEFRPDEDMESGETYEVNFNLAKVTATEKGLEEFDFDFRVINPGLNLVQEGLMSQNNTSLDYMKLSGEINTA